MNIDEINEGRFWSRVDQTDKTGCWPYTAGRVPYGYGAFAVGHRNYGAHRIAWALANGRWPDRGYQICHSCDNPPCCNPTHLFLGTSRDNWNDCIAKGRRRHVTLPPASEHAERMPRGESHWYARYTEAQIKEVRRLAREGMRQCDIMRATMLPRRLVQRVVSNPNYWAHVR